MASLRKSVIEGAAWTFGGAAATQLVRLGKSLILSRLLFPSAYGVVAIVWAILTGLNLLSDVGLSPAIVRSPRGDEPELLNTAWTMRVIRGIALCLATQVLAGPVALFYHKPELAPFLRVASLAVLIEGFGSTKTYSCQRHMIYSKVTLAGFVTDVVGLLSTVIWALISPTAWALVGGAVVQRAADAIGSHLLLPGKRNRFQWDWTAYSELLNFGKWVFLSSAVFLIYSQGDRLVLGKLLTISLLGIYSIAALLAGAVSGVVTQLTDSVLFPALSRTARTDKGRLRDVMYRARFGVDIFLLMPIGILMATGAALVHLAYDPRYQEAGWMLQVLTVRLALLAMTRSSVSTLFALGEPRYSFFQSVGRACWMFAALPIGWALFQIKGVVWAIALTELPAAVIAWSGLIRYRLLAVRYEVRSLAFLVLGVLVGVAILQLVPVESLRGLMHRTPTISEAHGARTAPHHWGSSLSFQTGQRCSSQSVLCG